MKTKTPLARAHGGWGCQLPGSSQTVRASVTLFEAMRRHQQPTLSKSRREGLKREAVRLIDSLGGASPTTQRGGHGACNAGEG